ncbi:SET domain-containing protein [Lentinus tigrinus ALCF2SS1-7]|uniref:SET domain-containing protein n=1 Tax=Lentinus tigrinus ALCF2SS1-6 TaxID=1328759 RepID=A0A5C2SBZ8_9APHY|nr:SET domain-containing protein [Lentinus tigrinus ALCF2SS1-6]RPD69842.1 SET domain-containing protein [Lentinus tigrinus ALCF2SS1-7]
MRRGFLLSTPRESRKATTHTGSADSGPGPALERPSAPAPEKKPSLPVETAKKLVPIPTSRYRLPPPLPPYPPGFVPSMFRCTEVPRGAPPATQTMFIYYDTMKEALEAKYPGWPLAFSTPSPPLHEVKPIDGAGLGLVATQDIAAGELILRERPYLVQPRGMISPIPTSTEGLYRAIENIVGHMQADNKRGLYGLKNSKGNALPTELAGIVDTNSQAAGPFPGYNGEYAGVARDISRANHSCNSNAHHAFDTATMTFSLRAFRAIRAGEEITISYLFDPLIPKHARQAELRELYGFTCACRICRLTGSELERSDLARKAIRLASEKIAEDDVKFAKWVLDGAALVPIEQLPKMKKADMDAFSVAEAVWTLMKKDEVYEPNLWEPVLARLVKACAVLEHEQGVRLYATKAAELRMAYTGEDGGWREVAENPRQTEWWAKLGAKRVK